MLKRKLASVTALMLAMCLLFSGTSFAQGTLQKDTPVILIPGLGGETLYENVNTPEETELSFLRESGAEADLAGLVADVALCLTTGIHVDSDRVIRHLAKVAEKSHFNLDKNGQPRYHQGPHISYDSLAEDPEFQEELTGFSYIEEVKAEAGADNVYVFTYDWRLDANENGRKLRDYINVIKRNTGADRVALVAESEGCAVTHAYMDRYDDPKDVARAILVCPAYLGVNLTRALTNGVTSDGKQLSAFLNALRNAFPDSTVSTLLSLVTLLGGDLFDRAGQGLANLGENEALYRDFLIPLLGNIPIFYEFIPYAQYADGIKTLTAAGFLDRTGTVYQKVDAYHKTMGHVVKNLRTAEKNGVDIGIIVNYGMPGVPIARDNQETSDLVIEAMYASAGAVTAPYGETLERPGGAPYVSPDKVIDASTCALPDSTWFVANALHCNFQEGTNGAALIGKLAAGNVAADVSTVSERTGISQFTVLEKGNNIVSQ